MSIALVGIILVQAFWIKTTLDNKEEQFSLNINQSLKSVSEQIQSRELRDYLAVYQKLRQCLWLLYCCCYIELELSYARGVF